MANPPPVIYLLHGEDEFAIAQFLTEIQSRLGDATTAALNTTRLEGSSFSLDQLYASANAMPFLASRRLVILFQPLSHLSDSLKEKFKALLDQLPPTTALVLVENKTLHPKNWLLAWAQAAGSRAYVRSFSLLKGGAMVKWIQEQAKAAGGEFTPQAAALLASLVGDDARLAYQEIQKLLAYANYQRPVEPDDVENLAASVSQGDIFAMVDALGNQDGRRAMGMLQRLLNEQDPLSIFGMVVRQFRLLLLAREVLDRGGREGDVARELRVHPFVAGKVTAQARHFSIPTLEMVYHRLLGIDKAIKTGQIDGDLALDTLVAAFTTR